MSTRCRYVSTIDRCRKSKHLKSVSSQQIDFLCSKAKRTKHSPRIRLRTTQTHQTTHATLHSMSASCCKSVRFEASVSEQIHTHKQIRRVWINSESQSKRKQNKNTKSYVDSCTCECRMQRLSNALVCRNWQHLALCCVALCDTQSTLWTAKDKQNTYVEKHVHRHMPFAIQRCCNAIKVLPTTKQNKVRFRFSKQTNKQSDLPEAEISLRNNANCRRRASAIARSESASQSLETLAMQSIET